MEAVIAMIVTAVRASIGYVPMIAGISRRCAYTAATSRIAEMLFPARFAGLTAAVMVAAFAS